MSGKSNAPNLPGGHYDPFDDNWETLLDSGQLDAKLDRLVMQAPPPLPIYRDKITINIYHQSIRITQYKDWVQVMLGKVVNYRC